MRAVESDRIRRQPARQASALRLTSSPLYCDRATAVNARIRLINLRQIHFQARLRQVVALLLQSMSVYEPARLRHLTV